MKKIIQLFIKNRILVAILLLLALSSWSTVALASANSVVVQSDSVNVRVGPD
ncbi:hypothetical protein [Companilactobacillus kimchii]|uniref:hypothetical protein n=1 Tax=Companilactobacillus kimchii TaxID=2801452 RepID=UPI000B1EAA05|nr:hypothetical protein [Companilactobacillus kimchii]